MVSQAVAEATISVGQSIDQFVANQRKLVVVPNMGNAGDSLINYAMYSLLRKRGIAYSTLEARHIQDPDPASTYLLMVNGGLHAGENDMDRVIKRLGRQSARMIFHSATIKDRDELLLGLPESTVIITREPTTFGYVRSIRPELQSLLSEDATMGIADGDADFPNPSFLMRLEYRLRLIRNTLRAGYPWQFALAPKAYRSGRNKPEIFSALRTDNESAGANPLEPGNVDLSVVCGGGQGPGHAEASAALMLGIIRSKQTIRTDRLHVAISSCLTGVECLFSANSYFKCEAIYNHSLARRFSNIKWMPRT